MKTFFYNVVETSAAIGESLLFPLPAAYKSDLDAQACAETILAQRLDPKTRADQLPARIVVSVWESEPDLLAGQKPDAVVEWPEETLD